MMARHRSSFKRSRLVAPAHHLMLGRAGNPEIIRARQGRGCRDGNPASQGQAMLWNAGRKAEDEK